jgi:hypothetical protein
LGERRLGSAAGSDSFGAVSAGGADEFLDALAASGFDVLDVLIGVQNAGKAKKDSHKCSFIRLARIALPLRQATALQTAQEHLDGWPRDLGCDRVIVVAAPLP